jgi:putative flippase GtrA
MSGEELNSFIYNGLNSNKPFMVARFGSVELDSALYTYLCGLPLLKRYKLYIQKKIPFLRYDKCHAKSLMNPLCNNAGFFPNDVNYLEKFGEKVRKQDVSQCCCCCCCWNNEDLMMPYFSDDIVFGELAQMEPYDYSEPWSRALKGKKVLVIHPFADTILSQYQNNRDKIFPNSNALPVFDLKCVKAVQTIADSNDSRFSNWFEALDYMTNEIIKVDYWVSYLVSLLLSIVWNFTINRKVTFKSSNNIAISMLLVLLFYAVFTPVSTILGELAENNGVNEYIVLIITMISNFILEFLYTRFVVYKNSCDTLK